MVDLARKILLHDKMRFLITVSGVAFAVTLVFVQVGLFEGLLDNASVTIERIDADLWVTARNTPNVDFSNTFPETLRPARPLDPRRGAGRQPDRLVRRASRCRPAPRRTRSSTPSRTSPAGASLDGSLEGDPRDLRRGKYVILDDSARKRFGAFAVGDYREFFGQRLKIIGRTARGALVHDQPDRVRRLPGRPVDDPAGAAQPDDLHPREARPGGRRRGGPGRDPPPAAVQRRPDPGRVGGPLALLLDRQHRARA